MVKVKRGDNLWISTELSGCQSACRTDHLARGNSVEFDHSGWKIRSLLAGVTRGDQYGKFCEAASAAFGARRDDHKQKDIHFVW